MSDSVSIKAYAKLNLNLDITGRSPDGEYHTVEMVMQSVDLYDTVTVSKADILCVSSNDDAVPENDGNICYKAAKLFFEKVCCEEKAEIKIKKRIPTAAGLGGGSADAAATLKALNELFNAGLSDDELCEIACEIGSDVPFCIEGGTQLAEGRGTILNPLPEFPDCTFVIVKDGIKPSTGEMYRRFDLKKDIVHPQTSMLVDAICAGELYEAAGYMQNVFEVLWDNSVLDVKKKFVNYGALCACLSGSGPSIFGVFDDEQKAKICRDELINKYEQVFICQPVRVGNE